MSERPVRVPFLLAASAAWSWRLLVSAAAVALIVFVLAQVYVVVVPVVLALFVAAVLEPLVARLRRRGWPSALAAATVFVGSLAVIASGVGWIGTSVAGQFDDLGAEVDRGVEQVKRWLQGEPFNLSGERIDQLQQGLLNVLRPTGTGLSERVISRARAVTEVAGAFVLMLFTLFFLLKDGKLMADWLVDRVPPAYRDDVVAVSRHGRNVMRQYLVATALTGFIDAVLIGIALLIIGVPLVLPLALLTFIGGFLPIVGATIAGLVAALVALVSGGFASALLVVAATVAVQQVEGNLLQPLILERAVKLHPLVTVWAVGAGLVVGGLLGAFLSVPLVAVAAGLGQRYRARPDAAQPAQVEVEGRPAASA